MHMGIDNRKIGHLQFSPRASIYFIVGLAFPSSVPMTVIPYSILDLSPIVEGAKAADALRNSASLARLAEKLGYNRYWVAEHHNMPGIASAATAVVIAHIASSTHAMRVGAGGVMLPNHAPLVIAEQFGTLESLYPGQIGRAHV